MMKLWKSKILANYGNLVFLDAHYRIQVINKVGQTVYIVACPNYELVFCSVEIFSSVRIVSR